MSRSRRKTPKIRWANAGSQKGWRNTYNRSMRHRNKQNLDQWYLDEDLHLDEKHIEYSDCWDAPQDGQAYYFGYQKYERTEYSMWFKTSSEIKLDENNYKEYISGRTLTDKIIKDIIHYVEYYGAYYMRTKSKLAYTQEEELETNKKQYNEWMRK